MEQQENNYLKTERCIILNNELSTYPEQALNILHFKAGELIANFPDSIKKPGIYGTLLRPIELLDTLFIENGKNTNDVRFAAIFIWDQKNLNRQIDAGIKIELSENLILSFVKE